MTIIVATFVFIAWTVYRLISKENILLEDIFLKPFIWLLPIYIVNGHRDLGLGKKHLTRHILIGLAAGLILSLERLFVNHPTLNFSYLAIVSAFFTAITEEIFFRGYLLNRWLKNFQKPIFPLVLNGLFFTLTHIPVAIFVYHYSGNGLAVYLLTNFISGFVDVYLFYLTRSAYTSMANHFVWNLFSGIFR
ncbi:CPBP family intramembrane metalloprotease [Candidatus Shapirobacteria bacterium]|nr:CPBP family intramembrane metalloprotease [Candidatus Shapirobacteria bacterium]